MVTTLFQSKSPLLLFFTLFFVLFLLFANHCDQSRRHEGAMVGLAPTNKVLRPQIEI